MVTIMYECRNVNFLGVLWGLRAQLRVCLWMLAVVGGRSWGGKEVHEDRFGWQPCYNT